MPFYKISIVIYNALVGKSRLDYLEETEILLDPYRSKDEEY